MANRKITPSEQISAANQLNADAVRPQGSFLRQHFRGQWGTPQGVEHVAGNSGSDQAAPRFSNRSTRYLRSLDFGFIRTRFMSMRGNSQVQRRANFFLFAIPIVISLGAGAMHLGSQSFLIYLKYQAIVDAYYYQEVLKKPVASPVEESESESKPADSQVETQVKEQIDVDTAVVKE